MTAPSPLPLKKKIKNKTNYPLCILGSRLRRSPMISSVVRVHRTILTAELVIRSGVARNPSAEGPKDNNNKKNKKIIIKLKSHALRGRLLR